MAHPPPIDALRQRNTATLEAYIHDGALAHSLGKAHLPAAFDLFAAVLRRDHDALAAAVEQNPFVVDTRDAYGCTALHYAAAGSDDRAIDLLLQAGALVDPLDHEGLTPLQRALDANALPTARLLIEAGAPCTALDAARVGAADALGRLVDADPQLLQQPGTTEPLLDAAIASDDPASVKVLVQRLADTPDARGQRYLDAHNAQARV